MEKQKLIEDVMIVAYKYAKQNSKTKEGRATTFKSIIREAVKHVKNKNEIKKAEHNTQRDAELV